MARIRLRAAAMSTLRPSELPQTYENALHLLSLLPTNRDVTSLFSAGRPAAADDLNAAAIPEMLAWLARAGYTQDDLAARLRCIHVAGTKGKGSVCAFLTAILTAHARAPVPAQAPSGPHGRPNEGQAGADEAAARALLGTVGTYLSPHVVTVRERILLDGTPVSKPIFTSAVFEIWRRLTAAARAAGADADAADGPTTKPFYFRFLTLVALHVFATQGVRAAVVECGIGAEHDATNVLPAAAVAASVVTRLAVDHVAMLGATVDAIAWHKAGVFKAGVAAFAVADADADAALRVLRARARDKGALLREIDGRALARWDGVPGAALPGAFQKGNMALAAVAARHFLGVLVRERHGGGGREAADDDGRAAAADVRLDDVPAAFRAAMRTTTLRGRCETVAAGGVEWFVDGAHTADSLGEVARLFAGRARGTRERRVLLFNQQERDTAALVGALVRGAEDGDDGGGGGVFDLALFTRNEVVAARAADVTAQEAAAAAMRALSPVTESTVWDNVSGAVGYIQGLAAAGDDSYRVYVTGSFHLVRAVLQVLRPEDAE